MFTLCLVLGLSALSALGAACSSKVDPSFSPSVSVAPAPAIVEFVPVTLSDEYTYGWDFGDSGSSQDQRPSHTYQDAGDFTVALTISRSGKTVATGRSQVRIEPGPAGWATITPPAAELSAGESQQFEAHAFDELGNPIPDAVITWAADPDTGQITPEGLFTAALGIGTYEEGISASFERLGKTGTAKAAMTLKPGPAAGLQVDPERIDVMAGARLTLTARLIDANGLPVPGGDLTFEALRSDDRVDANGLFRVSTESLETDSDLVRVKASAGDKTFEHIVRGIVTPGVLDQIIVTPAEIVLPVKGRATMTATGFDRFGNEVKLDSIKWSLLTPDPGEVSQDGVFTAGTVAGDFSDNYLLVQGARDRIETSTSVALVITPGDAAGITILPKKDSVPAGAGSTFAVEVKDIYGNMIEEPPVVWEAAAPGDITEDGVYIAPYVLGDYPAAVRVSLPPRSLGNLVALTDTADISVRQRSADALAVETADEDGAGIYIIDFATGEIRPIVEALAGNDASEFSPSWTSDGTRVVFGSNLGEELDIYVVEFATGVVRRLTREPGGAVSPAVSPDGSRIAYLSIAEEEWQVYVIPLTGLEEGKDPALHSNATGIKVSSDATSRHLLPSWSPDGKTLAYTRDDGLGNLKVILADTATLKETVVTLDDKNEVVFGWSADGTKLLAAQEDENDDLVLLIIDVATGARTPVADLDFPVSVAGWSPDGSELFIIDGVVGGLWLADSDGTGFRQVVTEDATPRRAAWRPVALKPPS